MNITYIDVSKMNDSPSFCMHHASAVWAMLASFFFATSSNLHQKKISNGLTKIALGRGTNLPVDDILVRVELGIVADQAVVAISYDLFKWISYGRLTDRLHHASSSRPEDGTTDLGQVGTTEWNRPQSTVIEEDNIIKRNERGGI